MPSEKDMRTQQLNIDNERSKTEKSLTFLLDIHAANNKSANNAKKNEMFAHTQRTKFCGSEYLSSSESKDSREDGQQFSPILSATFFFLFAKNTGDEQKAFLSIFFFTARYPLDFFSKKSCCAH